MSRKPDANVNSRKRNGEKCMRDEFETERKRAEFAKRVSRAVPDYDHRMARDYMNDNDNMGDLFSKKDWLVWAPAEQGKERNIRSDILEHIDRGERDQARKGLMDYRQNVANSHGLSMPCGEQSKGG
jgi:hypothetical protein